MNLSTVASNASQLDSQDKLRLAALMIDQALSEQATNTSLKSSPTGESEEYLYCLERVLKSRPNRVMALQNYLDAMLNFRGNSAVSTEEIIARLEHNGVISITNQKVEYPT